MSRALAMAVTLALMGSAASAADLTHQLVGPRFNPGLKTVPYAPGSSSVSGGLACVQDLAAHIDSGTVAVGPQGLVAHVTGTAWLGSDAELLITYRSQGGDEAEADLVACGPAHLMATPAPVHAALNLKFDAIGALRVRSQTNSILLPMPQ